MKPLNMLRGGLGWKLFLSYIGVILVEVVVLAIAAEFFIPNAFNRHMNGMMGSGEMMGMMGSGETDLLVGFRAAFNEILLLAAVTALIFAAVASYLITRRIVSPVQALTTASRRIAAGHYDERVAVESLPGREDEIGHLAGSFNTMAAQLAETEVIRRRLIGDVAHELRTPLTTIKGSLEGLIDGVLPPEEPIFQQVYLEAARLERLVNDLQELSRVESGASPLNLQPVEIGTLVHGVASRMQMQYADKGVSLEVNCAADLPGLPADSDRLTQVLMNLLGNALQYTAAGGAVSIECQAVAGNRISERIPPPGHPDVRAGKWLLIEVRDTGVGIAAEHLPHVFDRFYRADPSRSRAGGGSGIGLTIARRLVSAHGGLIWAESAGIGKGSTFSFCLPMAGE